MKAWNKKLAGLSALFGFVFGFIIGSMGGTAALWAAQLASFPKFLLPQKTLTGKYNDYNSTLAKLGSTSSSRNRLAPNLQATGSHSVFRRDPVSGRVL